jgi:hypothetical protein
MSHKAAGEGQVPAGGEIMDAICGGRGSRMSTDGMVNVISNRAARCSKNAEGAPKKEAAVE